MKIDNSFLGRKKIFIFLGGCILVLLLVALLAPLIVPYDPLVVDLDHCKEPPGLEHWLGTDRIGRDVLSRIIWGTRISLFIGITTTALSLGLGICVGLIAGYLGGKVDTFFTMLIDLFLAFPSLLLAIGISVLLPPGLLSVMIALCLVGWASFARLFRGMVLAIKERTFVDAARVTGCSTVRILFSHILPHCLPLALIAASIKIGGFIHGEAWSA
jgi:peptide/nickel transport system permease protein